MESGVHKTTAAASPVEGWVEDDETVHRLAHWREEAIY